MQRHAGEKLVFGVQLLVLFVDAAGLTISGGIHNEPVHRLEAPAATREFGGEPVEQFRVRWPCAGFTKIVQCADDALAEVMFPNAVDHHARGERMLRARGPLCEGQPPPGLLGYQAMVVWSRSVAFHCVE